jgi:hypothetical protein
MTHENDRRTPRWITALTLITGLVALAIAYQPVDDQIGHDYYHALPRLLIGASHFWQHGWSLPHYTASLCGGIPFLADPQNSYFSLIQLLSFFVDPFQASVTSALFFHALGFLGGYLFFTRALHYRWEGASLGALAFTLNGFIFANQFVGHITHQAFLLAPWLLYFLMQSTSDRVGVVRQALGFALIVTYTLYSGGLHILVVFGLVILLGLPTSIWIRGARTPLTMLILAATFVLLTCSGRLAAAFLYSKNFFIEPLNRSSDPWLTQIVRYFWFDPAHTPTFLPFGNLQFGMWEYVGFMTKLAVPSTLLVLASLNLRSPATRKMLAAYAVLIPLLILISTGSDVGQHLPVFRHYHNPIKLLGAFVPFLAWTVAWAVDWLGERRWLAPVGSKGPILICLLGTSIILSEFGVYAGRFVEDRVGLGFRYAGDIYRDVKAQGKIRRVTEIVGESGQDLVGLVRGTSSLKCYEPSFGYRNEGRTGKVVPGPASQVSEGYFNLTHPGCLLYPKYFHCQPWDRIAATDASAFSSLVNGDAGSFGVPLWQRALYVSNLIFLLLALAACTVRRRPVVGNPFT